MKEETPVEKLSAKKRWRVELRSSEESGSEYAPSNEENIDSPNPISPEPMSTEPTSPEPTSPEPTSTPQSPLAPEATADDDEPVTTSQGPFPFLSDYEKLECLRSRYRRLTKQPDETFATRLPEVMFNRIKYMSEEEIRATYKKEIDALLAKITEASNKRDEALRRLASCQRLYATSKSKGGLVHRVHSLPLKRPRPVFLCPLLYRASHVMNMKRHRIIAHSEIKTEADKELFDVLVHEMKIDVSEKVASIGSDSITQNQAYCKNSG